MEHRLPRKLAAILYADVAGYSRLTGADEDATHRHLTEYLDLIAATIEQHRGRVMHYAGDAVLAKFDAVVDAISAAVVIQNELKTRNEDLSYERKVQFRIGVNSGDVIEDRDDIYGDGVNVAARLESLADPGGICISESVRTAVGKKLDLGYEFMGEQKVKNIEEPVRAYRAELKAGATLPQPSYATPAAPRRLWTTWVGTAAVVIVLIVGGLLSWLKPWEPREEPASVERMAFPLPDKPSIAVLPFTNMSDDPQQEYFVDGMTEDLITDLSKLSGLFVIARNSVFTYKGRPVKVQQVAEELGVRYVLEGSVRRADSQVRINAQLIDATTGGHLWGERYDGNLDDVFALQDKIAGKIVSALSVQLTTEDLARAAVAETDSPEAYDAFLKGWAHFNRQSPNDYAKAREHFERAIELDPDYSQAFAALAATYWESYYRFWQDAMKLDALSVRNRAEVFLEKALVNPTPLALQVSSKMHWWWGKWESAIVEAKKALALNPSDAGSHITLAEILIWNGQAQESFDLIDRARRLDPHNEAYHVYVEGLAEFALGKFQEAAASLESAFDLNPEYNYPLPPLAASYAHVDRLEDARRAVKMYCEGFDNGCLGAFGEAHYFPFRQDEDRNRFIEGLRKAGMPD